MGRNGHQSFRKPIIENQINMSVGESNDANTLSKVEPKSSSKERKYRKDFYIQQVNHQRALFVILYLH